MVTVERVIPAAADTIFDLIADPSRHRDIDGSGSVRRATGGPKRLKLGDRFGMAMRIGVPYAMVSTVIELEENRQLLRSCGFEDLVRDRAPCPEQGYNLLMAADLALFAHGDPATALAKAEEAIEVAR